jgi:hypothetical protein
MNLRARILSALGVAAALGMSLTAAAAEPTSPDAVKNALRILAYVLDDMAHKLPTHAYARLPHERQWMPNSTSSTPCSRRRSGRFPGSWVERDLVDRRRASARDCSTPYRSGCGSWGRNLRRASGLAETPSGEGGHAYGVRTLRTWTDTRNE